ncbi:MATE family efflux transporter [Bradyrhizobium yuanmingense]|uniref:MATE family efflux transporter n=1 Tax=Bradyrhizobium yuanmingense TaxID=108015 RepID=UPI0023BA3402|nr:MATE family efflux transporter [Bradyrhizobium yuanmingense]MDF0581965.1 MATE family efflux transporter [Bradyrhizobium yuanmingense]
MRRAANHLLVELSETAKVAWPVVLTQLGQVAMMTTDLALIGHIGAKAVAAAALAGKIYVGSILVGTGLLAAIAPSVAQAFAADDLGLVRRSLGVGLWAALALSIPITLLTLHCESMFLVLGQSPDVARLAQQYLFGLVFGCAPALCFIAIRNYMGAVKRAEPAMWITIMAVPLNALLGYLLIYGKLGLPRQELFGAGLATTLVNYAVFLAGFWMLRNDRVVSFFWQFDWSLMRRLFVIGIPISITFLIEYGISCATAVLMGLISTKALAAHQIAFQVATILFVIPSGVSTAATVRVSYAIGRKDALGVKKAGLAAILLAFAIVAYVALGVIAARRQIAEFFLDGSADEANATVELAAQLLLVSVGSFVAAAVCSTASASLRGLEDTRMPILFACIANWGIGFSLSYMLAFKTSLGAAGVWIGSCVGMTVYATLLVLRFQLLTSRLTLRNQPFLSRNTDL